MKKTILVTTSLIVAAIAASPIHDKMDSRIKGKSYLGSLDDNAAAQDGLGILPLQHHTGTADMNTELLAQKVFNRILKTETDKTKTINIKDSFSNGLVGTIDDQKLLLNYGDDLRYLPGSMASCKEILAKYPQSASGKYLLTNNTDAYCDMTTDGGGWTAIASFVDNSYFMTMSSAVYSNGVTLTEEKVQRKVYNAAVARGNSDTIFTQDTIMPAYSNMPFTEMMFTDNKNNFLSYGLSSSSMKNYYLSIAGASGPLKYRIPVKRSSVASSVNLCNTLEVAMDSADQDGGAINYETRRTSAYSPLSYGPAWDYASNGGCHYDDEGGHAMHNRFAGSPSLVTPYILWFVR